MDNIENYNDEPGYDSDSSDEEEYWVSRPVRSLQEIVLPPSSKLRSITRDDPWWIGYYGMFLEDLKMITSSSFYVRYIFEINMFNNTFRDPILRKLIELAFNCTKELVDFVVFDRLNGIVTLDTIKYVIVACFTLAIKTTFAYDFLNKGTIFEAIDDYFVNKMKIEFDIEMLYYIESAILEATDWKGCNSLLLDQYYDHLLEEIYDRIDYEEALSTMNPYDD